MSLPRAAFVSLPLSLILLASAAPETLWADIRRVVVTQDEDGKVSRSEEPLSPAEDKDHEEDDEPREKRSRRHYRRQKHHSGGTIDLSGPSDGGLDAESSQELSRSLTVGYSATHVFHQLTTGFETAGFNPLFWDSSPDLGGRGVEFAIHPLGLDFVSLGARGGFFQQTQTANMHAIGASSVQERVHSRGAWGNFELMSTPFYGLSVAAGVGGLNYKVDTAAITNATAYRYEGLTGSRTVMIYGLGGQFEMPWSFFLKPYVQGRYWWTAGAGDPVETAIGQFGAGLTARF